MKGPSQPFANWDQAEKAAELLQDCFPSANVWAKNTGTEEKPEYRVAITVPAELKEQYIAEKEAYNNATEDFKEKYQANHY